MMSYDRITQAVLRRPVELGQYASADYQRALAARGIVASMSRRGDCWDNAVAESFFATLKVELAHEAQWPTRAHAQDDVFEYLEGFYNGRRRHSALGYLSPLTFEHQWWKAPSRLTGSSAEMASSAAASDRMKRLAIP